MALPVSTWHRATANSHKFPNINCTQAAERAKNAIFTGGGAPQCLILHNDSKLRVKSAVYSCLVTQLHSDCGRFCFWRRQFVVFCFVYKISWEPLNRFVPNSHGRCVWCLARTRLKIKVRGHGHQGQKRHFSALSAACLRFMFGKSYVASTCYLSYCVFAI